MTDNTTLYKIDYSLRKNSFLQIQVEEYLEAAKVVGEGAFFRGANISAIFKYNYTWRDGALTPFASDWAFLLILGDEKLKKCLHELFRVSNAELDDDETCQYVEEIIDELDCSRTRIKLTFN